MKKFGSLVFVVMLIALTAAAFAGTAQNEKPRLGVLRFTNHTSAGWWSASVADDLSDMLASELSSEGSFQVLERKEIDAVMGEQDLGQSGRVSASTRAKMGQIKGAKFLIAGTVSSYEETRSTGGGVSLGGISLGGNKDKTYIAIDVKVVDTDTGEIVDTRTIEAESGGLGLGAGVSVGNFSIHGADYKKTPAGKAIRACIIYVADYLSCSLGEGKDASCMKKWNDMDQKRRDRTKGVIDIK